jgi:hypothetical protein
MLAPMIDWADGIARIVRAKRLLELTDPPRPPAAPSRLRAAAEWAGGALDRHYAEFLRHADGWPRVLLGFGLFGTSDLLGPEFARARELIDMLEPDVLEDAGLVEDDLFPVGMGPQSIDVFATVTSAPEPGPVVWLAGLVVEVFDNFEEFFSYLVASNEELEADPPR